MNRSIHFDRQPYLGKEEVDNPFAGDCMLPFEPASQNATVEAIENVL